MQHKYNLFYRPILKKHDGTAVFHYDEIYDDIIYEQLDINFFGILLDDGNKKIYPVGRYTIQVPEHDYLPSDKVDSHVALTWMNDPINAVVRDELKGDQEILLDRINIELADELG